MAEPADTSEPAERTELAEPGSRGTLTVLDRAVERIADASLTRTSGVLTAGSSFGRRPSRVKVTKQDDHVRAAVDVTSRWPLSAATVATDLRRDIVRGMSESGLTTDSVDVHVGDFGETGTVSATGGATTVPAPRPLATPAATPLAILLSLLVLAAAAVLIRDGLVGLSVLTGTAWTADALDAIDGLTVQSWMFPAGIAAAVIGLLLVIAALKWRARRYRPSEIADDVWVHKSDVASLTEKDAVPTPAAATTPTTESEEAR